MPILVYCEFCGKDFSAYPSQVAAGSKFCDPECASRSRTANSLNPALVWQRFRSKVTRVAGPAHLPRLGYCERHANRPDGRCTKVYVAGRYIRAHRYVLAHRLGRDLLPGMYACHKCDNPNCCRSSHLFEGTPLDNVRDCVAKGRRRYATGLASGRVTKPQRTARGERSGKAILNEEAVRQIRNMHAAGETMAALGRCFGTAPTNIASIVYFRTWAHVA